MTGYDGVRSQDSNGSMRDQCRGGPGNLLNPARRRSVSLRAIPASPTVDTTGRNTIADLNTVVVLAVKGSSVRSTSVQALRYPFFFFFNSTFTDVYLSSFRLHFHGSRAEPRARLSGLATFSQGYYFHNHSAFIHRVSSIVRQRPSLTLDQRLWV